MDKLFNTVLELSWQAGLIALAVMAVRLLLRKRASRRALCLLWALVALRLVLPVSLTAESPVSLQAQEAPVTRVYRQMREEPNANVPVTNDDAAQTEAPTASDTAMSAAHFARYLPWLWVIGAGCMMLYMLLSLLWMRYALREAERIEGNVYRCARWSTPFVLGVFAPRIYVPWGVSAEDLPQVLSHERCHIRRWDHAAKPFAFLLLAVNWFNPVLWAAYVLLGRDMENACDEAVLRNADAAQRAAYSRALVACAAQPRIAAVCPLAFGETAVRERVKNVLGGRKPAVWAAVMLAVAAVIIGACLLTKPTETTGSEADAETLYALRTAYVGDNSAVGAILDALGFASEQGCSYGIQLSTDKEPMGVTVCYAFADEVPERSAVWNRQMAQRSYVVLALVDNIEWVCWKDLDQAAQEAVASGVVYAGDFPDEINAARESAEGLQALMNVLQVKVDDGSLVYYSGDTLPTFEETTPWSVEGDNDPMSVRAEDYGVVYGDTLPDWDTVPLSYLCAYYLNADGAYAEGAMATLAKRYRQAPNTVEDYIRRLSLTGKGDAAARLKNDIDAYMQANSDAAEAAAELEVYTVTWEAGDSVKQTVPLTAEQVQTIRSETGEVLPEWYQVCAELRQNGEDIVSYIGNEYHPVPPTVLQILTEQCGYTFVTPEDFRGNMTAAKLEFYGGETYTGDKSDLPALQKMLTNARAYGGASSCGFTAKLTVTFDDGRTVSVLKGTDSCASFMFGSWNTAMVSDSENEQFWQIFGVPFEG